MKKEHLMDETDERILAELKGDSRKSLRKLASSIGVSPSAVSERIRRMGYRVSLDDPNPERYARIFSRYAAQRGLEVPPGLVDAVLDRYRAENRPMRACEPRDLIERVRDICAYRGRPDALTPEVLDIAWTGYFGAGGPPG